MKKSDIVIGQEYAYSTYESGRKDRVRVLGEARVQQGWGYRAKTISGSRILLLENATGEPKKRKDPQTGEEVDFIVDTANRNIRELWAPYWEREVAAAKARRDSVARRRSDKAERASMLLDLIPALRHSGFLDVTGDVRDLETKKAIEAVDEQILHQEGEGVWARTILTAPLAPALSAFVEHGKPIGIEANALLRILDGRNVR